MPDRSLRSILISVWVALVLFLSISPAAQLLTGHLVPLSAAPATVTLVRIVGLFVLIFLVVGFVRRNALAIWISVAVLALWALSALVRVPVLLNDLGTYGVSVVLGIAMVVLNVLCILAILQARSANRGTDPD